MRRNWMPLYIPDFLADTMHLSTVETGAYLCLIMDYWLHDGLPDDDHKLASITRLPVKSWRQMRPTIEAFFRPGWRHKRVDIELAKMVRISTKRQEAASKAGTVSAIKRANATSTSRVRNVHTTLTSRAPDVHHSTQESLITSTFVGTAREGLPREPVETSNKTLPQDFAERAREALQREPGLGSGELVATMQAKGWVKP